MTVSRLCVSVPKNLKANGLEIYPRTGGNKRSSFPEATADGMRRSAIVDEAYAGDIIGVFDPGIFSPSVIPDKQKTFKFGNPNLCTEHFARVRQVDTMKRKQFLKGMQSRRTGRCNPDFQEYNMGMEEVIVGVVGVLQFDV